VNALMPQLRAAYTQEAKNFVRAIREANKPKGFFDKLFG
jgi:diadenosine tetraphosphate (Ap4A) HIT family hydrolase